MAGSVTSCAINRCPHPNPLPEGEGASGFGALRNVKPAANLYTRWTCLLAIQVATYLPIWKWYLARITDGSDEPWGLVALLAAALIVFFVNRKETLGDIHLNCESTTNAIKVYVPRFNREVRRPKDSGLLLPSLLIVAYAATYWFVPRLVQATIAMTALGCTVSTIALGVRIHIPTLGLLMLSLPVVPSLQFYLGYPIRVLCGSLTAPLLQLGGIAVVREGTSLRWGSELVSIDAPCSGIGMLFAGLFLAFVLSSLFRLSPLKTMLAAGAAVCAVILGNVWRSAALFYLESNILIMPEWCHEAVGVAIFAGVAIFILWIADRLRCPGTSYPVPKPKPGIGTDTCSHSLPAREIRGHTT